MCAPRVTQHTSIRYSSSYHTRVNMSASIFFTAAMIRAFRSARSRKRVLCVLCTKCTLYSNHRLTLVVLKDSNQHPPPPPFHQAAIFSLHTLASPSGRNVNYDEKQLTGKKFLSFSFYLYRFRKYVSYSFSYNNFL